MDYTYKYEMEFNNTSVLRSPAEAYEAADEAEKARVRKLVQNMNLFDDDLMSRVFDQNIPATDYLLKTILQRNDLHVLSVVGQHELKTATRKAATSGWIFTPRWITEKSLTWKCSGGMTERIIIAQGSTAACSMRGC